MSKFSGPEIEMKSLDDGVTIRPEVLERARTMISAALHGAAVDEGVFQFQVSSCDGLSAHSRPFMDMQLSGQCPNMIFVRARTGGSPDSGIKGMLRLPVGTDRRLLFTGLVPPIENFNRDGWREVIQEIAPNPPPEGSRAKVIVPVIAGISRGNGHDQMPGKLLAVEQIAATALARPISPVAAVALSFPPAPVSPPAASPIQAPFPPASPVGKNGGGSDESEKLTQFLFRVLQGSSDGIFPSKGTGPLVREFFPKREQQGLVMATFSSLVGRQWIRKIEPGRYQIEPSFVERHHLSISLAPLPEVQPKKVRQKGPITAVRQAVASSLDLVAQLRAIDSAIEALVKERMRLEENVVAARDQLTAAEKALRMFNEQVEPGQHTLAKLYVQP